MSWNDPASFEPASEGESMESTAPMSPEELYQRLVHILMYRDLCRSVQRSGRENFFFASLMAFFAFLSHKNGGGNDFFLLVYAFFITGELFIAFYKWFFPSAEGVLCDALILLAFALLNGILAYVQFQAGFGPNPIVAFLIGVFLLGAWRHWQGYRHLRILFRIRPSRAHLRWFEQFLQEIRQGDPHTDATIVELPTRPGRKAALLGQLVVVVGGNKQPLELATPEDFRLLPIEDETGDKKDWVRLLLNGQAYPPFPIDPASWDNYRRWRQSLEQESSPRATP